MKKTDLENAIRKAVGASPDDVIRITKPQFTRTPDMPAVAAPPMDRVAWEQIKSMSAAALKEMGLARWDEPDDDGRVLMLFPGEWYRHIPAGYEVETINGEIRKHVPSIGKDDIRFGCLAYGVRVAAK